MDSMLVLHERSASSEMRTRTHDLTARNTLRDVLANSNPSGVRRPGNGGDRPDCMPEGVPY